MIIYQILKLNRYDPDIPNKRGKLIQEKATYRATRAHADLHYMQNERTKASRVRGYLEWFWKNTDEGKEIMQQRRQRKKEKEKDIRESLKLLKEEQQILRNELDKAN